MKLQKKDSRSSKGFSLATVIIIGIIATLFVTAMFGAIMPSYQRTTNVRTRTIVRNAAEAGLDWAVSEYNKDGGVSSGLEGNLGTATFAQLPMAGQAITMPSAKVNYGGYNQITPTVTVQAVSAQPPATSYIYDPTVALLGGTAQLQTNNITTNSWRVLTATATGPGGLTRQLQAVIKPIPASPTGLAALKANTADFSGTNFKTDAVNTGGPAPPNNIGGDIDINNSIDVSGMDIKGAVTVRQQTGGETTKTYLTGNSKTHIYGVAKSNGLISAATKSAATGIEGKYVDSSNTLQTSTPKYYESLNLPQFQMPTIGLHPPGAIPHTPMTGSGTLGVAGVPTTYYFDQGSGAQMTAKGSTDITILGPTKIYLEGSGDTPIAFGGNATITTKSGRAQDFVIYYNGKGTIDMAGVPSFTGVIIAPNATINFKGNANVTGAVLGNAVFTKGGGNSGGIHYDVSLNNVNLLPTNMSYQTVTWRELN